MRSAHASHHRHVGAECIAVRVRVQRSRVSETFPVEIRAEAIAVFFAIAQVFGAVGPILFGALIGAGNNPSRLFIGYAIGGGLMIVGGIVELLLGVAAERKELEQIARPLTAVTATQVPRAPMPENSLLAKLQAARPLIGGRLTTGDPSADTTSNSASHLGGFDDHPRLPLSSGKRKTPRKRPSPPGSASHAGPTEICRVSPGGTTAAPRSPACSPGEEHLMVVAGRRHPPRSGGPAVKRLAAGTRRLVPDALRRDPQDRWAAAFGRIAGYSFAVAVVTGVLLLPFFRPSMATVVYHGSYSKLDGATMSQAYRSVLAISFDVRGGLLIRQVHHWSADLFVAAIILRLLRVFFRGRFSGRALPDWLIWVALLPLGMLAAYTGTILPDDGLSGGSLGVITGVLLSVPVIGTHLVFWIFGGAPPGHQIIGRDYWVHILVLPALAGALLLAQLPAVAAVAAPGAARSAAAVHLRGAGPARHDRADQPGVAGRAVPAGQHQRRRGAGLVHGVPRRRAADHAGLGADGSRASAGPRRADPGPGRARPVLHLPAGLALYPLADRRITGGRPPRGLLPPTPADPANRTAVGVAGVTLYGLLWAAAANDEIAYHLHLDPSVHGHLDIPGARAGRADAGVPPHPGHLPRAGRPATRRGTARPGNRADREEPARRL